ncbi:MAG: 30S ribosomal protein S18 [Candidatus Aminicenantales bacterium]|jgi:small subunit ribosomal protein S18
MNKTPRSGGREDDRRERGDRPERGEKGGYRKFFPSKRKFCRFCQRNIRDIDYKNVDILRKYVPDRGKISPRRVTGTCSFHQRKLAQAIKRARLMALLYYVEE